jgi:hypothetical protein
MARAWAMPHGAFSSRRMMLSTVGRSFGGATSSSGEREESRFNAARHKSYTVYGLRYNERVDVVRHHDSEEWSWANV